MVILWILLGAIPSLVFGEPFPIVIKPNETGSCLLYIESVSVVAYNKGSASSFTSAAANFNHLNANFNSKDVKCLESDSKDGTFNFHIGVTSEKEVVVKDGEEELFSVSGGIEFNLKFIAARDLSWHLVDVELGEAITLTPKKWITKEWKVSKESKSVNANHIYFGGYNDYGYACSDSPAIVWMVKDTENAIGLVFNNIQLQAFGLSKDQEGNLVYRFSTNVNDCHGVFSIGSWMAIVVILLLLGVLSFGFLMLNSVQTMDRFDDPKQKQLIINAKE